MVPFKYTHLTCLRIINHLFGCVACLLIGTIYVDQTQKFLVSELRPVAAGHLVMFNSSATILMALIVEGPQNFAFFLY